jgi:alkaline phosphatase
MSRSWLSPAVLAVASVVACGDDGDDDTEPAPDAAVDGADSAPDAEDPPAPDGGEPDRPTGDGVKRIVILMIGDGMGKMQLDAASLYAHGETDRLFLQSLPVHGEIVTGNLSGITDSAAAATTMATGVRTWNGSIGLDRDDQPVETVVELAHRLGRSAGIVTTALLPHATPGGFSAHDVTRNDYLGVADDQAREVRPDVMLGGGGAYFDPPGPGSQRSEGDLVGTLRDVGYHVARTGAELAAVDPASGGRLLGLFAEQHMAYVQDRPPDTVEPTLEEMSLAAVNFLDTDPNGFFLMIEGARIDMAGHGNDLARNVGETLAFDETVRAVAGWAEGRPEVTLLVTADHECGGMQIVEARPAGELPVVSWRWGQHTNARVALHGLGPDSEVFDGQVRDHVWVHAAIVAGLTGDALVAPPRELVPDGHLEDLAYRAAEQSLQSGFGPGYNELDALWIDADERGLSVGVEGLFEWGQNALVVLLDTDLGAGTGPSTLADAVADERGVVDGIVSSLALADPGVAGWGVDFALASFGGSDPRVEDHWDHAGLRGLHPPVGQPDDLWWYGVATNFGEGVRTRADPTPPVAAVAGEGWEARVAWTDLYPDLAGAVPPGATLGIAAILVNTDGGYTSNQALPAFPAGTENPGRTTTALPGVVRFVVDTDLDGIADGALPPTIE